MQARCLRFKLTARGCTFQPSTPRTSTRAKASAVPTGLHANAAPKILPLDQSVLHIWSAIEALFPNVGAELEFRIALYLAQLTQSGSARQEVYERVRASYDMR